MLKIDYRNPMAKTFQYEYALYLLMSELFHGVHCSSVFALETLKLYYMDLVSTNKSGYASYEKQYAIEEKIRYWIQRDLLKSKDVNPEQPKNMLRIDVTCEVSKLLKLTFWNSPLTRTEDDKIINRNCHLLRAYGTENKSNYAVQID